MALFETKVAGPRTKQYLQSFLARGITIGCSLLVLVLAARMLGPAGKGQYSYIVAIIGIGLQFGNLGIGTANLYFSAVDRALLGKLVVITGAVATAAVAFSFASFEALAFVAERAVPYARQDRALIAAAIGLSLAWATGQSILVGANKVAWFNSLSILYSVLLVGGMLFVFGSWGSSVIGIVIVQAGCAAIAALLLIIVLKRTPGFRLAFDGDLGRRVLGYGATVYIAQTFSFLLVRSDLLVVQYFLTSDDVGLYSLAGDFSNVIIQFQAVVNMLLFPRLATVKSESIRRAITRDAFLKAAVAYTVVLLGSYFMLEPAILMVFGADFVPAAEAVTLLLPGALFLALASILQNHLGSTGRPALMIVAPACAFATSVLLNLQLVPKYGISGAAVASSIAYGTMLAVAAYLVLRRARLSEGVGA